eukprot:COSAG04_NODE_5484_length_1600_cov_4.849434_2_plen_175_part_00
MMVLLHHFVINRGVVIGLRVHPRPLVHLRLTKRKVLDRPAKTFLVRRGLRKPRLLEAYDLSFFGSTHGVAAGDSHSAEPPPPPPPPPPLLLLAVVVAVVVVVRGSGLGSSSGSANDVTYQAAQPDQTLRLCKPREEGGGRRGGGGGGGGGGGACQFHGGDVGVVRAPVHKRPDA